MTGLGPALRAGAVRRALHAAFGLGLDGLSDQQVLAAATALEGGDPAVAEAGGLAAVVDALPIDESWMFRDETLWSWLQEELLPGLVVDALAADRPLRALSLGCSGGQEAHSLAILLLGLLEAAGVAPRGAAARAQVLGLDASPARVALAASGQATGWSVQRCPARWLAGRVRPLDPAGGRWIIDEAVRAMCRFEVGNLLDVARQGSEALRGADVVLCRHVLIYFRPAEAAAVVAGLAGALDPGATLILSPSEAHFATGLPGLELSGAVGAFRRAIREAPRAAQARAAAAAPAPRQRARPAPAVTPPRPTPLAAAVPVATAPRAAAPAPVVAGPAAAGPPPPPGAPAARRDAPIVQHTRAALEHAAAGRSSDALREARAACFLDPRHLLSRLVLGRELLSVDRYRGRAVLAELLELAGDLPEESAVPYAPGLSVGQLTAAALLLMQRGDPS